MTSLAAALSRRTISASGAWALGSATSAPMAVLLAIVSIYAGTDLRSLPLLMALVGMVIIVLLVGYSAMIRQVPHSAPYYAITARGIGRRAGVAAGLVALLSYNAIQLCLYGLLGSLITSFIGGYWWIWALIAVAAVYLLGVRSIVHSTRLVTTVLVLSLLVVAAVVIVSLQAAPVHGINLDGFSLAGLQTRGLALAIGLTVACFTGIDGAGALVEEESSDLPGRAVSTGMMASAWSLTFCYTVAAAALGMATGLGKISKASAADPTLPFTLLHTQLGVVVAVAAVIVLVLAIVTSMVAFHVIGNRYAFAMARERVLRKTLAGTSGTTAQAPVAGSRLQTLIAVLVIAGFAVSGANPAAIMFNWLALLGAMGLLLLLIVSNVSALVFFSRNRTPVNSWTAKIAPLFGVLFGSLLLIVMLSQLGSLLGGTSGSATPYLLPVLVVLVAVIGYGWASYLRWGRRDVYEGISYGVPGPLDVPDDITDFR
jgi:amino acid transporter